MPPCRFGAGNRSVLNFSTPPPPPGFRRLRKLAIYLHTLTLLTKPLLCSALLAKRVSFFFSFLFLSLWAVFDRRSEHNLFPHPRSVLFFFPRWSSSSSFLFFLRSLSLPLRLLRVRVRVLVWACTPETRRNSSARGGVDILLFYAYPTYPKPNENGMHRQTRSTRDRRSRSAGEGALWRQEQW